MRRRSFVSALGVTALSSAAGCPKLGGIDESTRDGRSSDPLFTVSALENLGPRAGEVFTVELVDETVAPDDPAEIRLGLENVTEETLRVQSPVLPFGVLRGLPHERSGPDFLLWSDAYVDSPHVQTEAGFVTGVDDSGSEARLAPGESLADTYQLRADPPTLSAGRYIAHGRLRFSIESESDDPSRFTPGITFDIEQERPRPDQPTPVQEQQRVDEPPYDIQRPEDPEDYSESDDWNTEYLGENLAETPSLAFRYLESVKPRVPHLADYEGGSEFRIEILENPVERDAVLELERAEQADRNRLEQVDFDSEVVVLVESGYGSSSIVHRWARVEDEGAVLHLYGYYTRPYLMTADLATRHSVVVVERPTTDLEYARVSLTTGEEHRVHFNSTEGVVAVE